MDAITCYNTKSVIEIIMAIVMLLGIGLLFHNRIKSKNKDGNLKGIGARIIQLATVLMLIPSLVILALEDVLKGETVGTLIGGLVGYILSGLSDYKPNSNNNID